MMSVDLNNPGNMKSGNDFMSFDSPKAGLEAMQHDLLLKILGQSPVMKSKYGEGYQPTLRNIISTWAPSSENNTDNYINFVSSHSGIDPDQPVTQEDVTKIMQPMIHMEGGKKASDYFGKLMSGIGDAIIPSAKAEGLKEVTDPEILKQLNSSSGLREVTDPNILSQLDGASSDNGFFDTMINNASHGITSIGDLLTGNFQNIREYKPTPATESLASKLFEGEKDIPTDPMGIAKLAIRKYQEGKITGDDYASAHLEKFGENAAGKAVSAIGGLVPTFNVVGTAIQKYVNPAISNATGLTENELALSELAASPLGLTTRSKSTPLPIEQAITKTADALTYPVRHPIDTATSAVNMAGDIAKPVIQPIIRGILESDNPITGEPGLKTSLASDTATEGVRLGKKMGVDFTAGELTGNPTAMGIEDALANSARYGGKFAEANQRKTEAIIGKFNETLDKINPESNSRADVGNRLGDAYRSTIDSLIKTRSEQGKIDFQSALEGSSDEGSSILSNNLFRELQAIASEGDAKLLTKSKAHGAMVARKLLNRVSTKTEKGNIQSDTISLQDMANGLSDFSSEAQRPGSIMDTAQSAAERRIYARLFGALQKDLDAEIDSPTGSPERAAMLKVARDNFRNQSNQIADIQKNTLGKIIGEADHDSQGNLVISPEKIADRFTKMEPTELKNTLSFLDKNHPDVANIARRYILEKSLRQAGEGRGLRGEGTTKEFAKAEFVKNLPDSDTLNILLKDPSAAADIKDVAAALNRMIDYGAQKKGSATAQRTDFLASIAQWSKGALYRSIVSDSLAEDLMNPTKRRKMAFEARNIKPQKTKITITPKDKLKNKGE